MIVTSGTLKATGYDVHESDITISVVTRADEFDKLAGEWDTLLEHCNTSIYQTFAWQRFWWKNFGTSDSQLHIIVLRRGARAIGIAPFFIATTRTLGLLPLRKLTFIGQGPSDYLDVLFTKGEEELCAARLAEYLAGQHSLFDIIHLEDFSDRLPNHALLFEALRKQGFRGDHFINEYCPRTQLKENWEATLASFKVDTRREIRRRARNIQKNFAVEFEIITDPAAAVEGIDAFIQLHQHKWTNIGHTGEFADPRCVRFHHEVVVEFARRGWLYLAFLRVNGERVATLYCFLFRDDLAVYLTGNSNRSDVYKFSPGRVLTAYCMEQAVARGKKVCDFMRGNEPYKYELDAVDVPNWAMLLYNPHSLKPEFRYRIELLSKSLKRRATHERLLYHVVAREHGVFSSAMRAHLKSRLKKNLADGTKKAKAPAQATHIQANAAPTNRKTNEMNRPTGEHHDVS